MGFWTKSPDRHHIELLGALEERVKRLERQQDELNQDIRDLAEKHLKLRGKIYALKLHKPEADDVPRSLTKDDLRRRLVSQGRFVPGRPAVHDDMTGDKDGD